MAAMEQRMAHMEGLLAGLGPSRSGEGSNRRGGSRWSLTPQRESGPPELPAY